MLDPTSDERRVAKIFDSQRGREDDPMGWLIGHYEKEIKRLKRQIEELQCELKYSESNNEPPR